jgi:diketogulonate reductase-like aldo/keto reductase
MKGRTGDGSRTKIQNGAPSLLRGSRKSRGGVTTRRRELIGRSPDHKLPQHTPLADGDIRQVESRYSRENLPHNLALVNLVKKWAERENATPAQIALAWLMAQKPWIVPIPGTTQMAHMLENVGADAVRLTPSELAELNASVSAIQIRGARLPDQVLVFSGVEAPPK